MPLGGRAFDLLVALWERRDRVVDKGELIDLVWPGRVVEENNLQVQIGTLRKFLGAEAIATVQGRGYRFTGSTHLDVDVAPSQPSVGPVQAALLPRLERLHGREPNLAALGALVERHPLVTLVGAGGIGKTVLARHLVEARGEGCWVDLADLPDAGLVVPAVAAALGIDTGPGDPLHGLCAALSTWRQPLVLDTAEHLLDAVSALARALLHAAPGVRLLVTSQAPLMLSRECVYRLGPLSVPKGPLPAAQALGHSAVALFDERARSVDPEFLLDDELAAEVIALCSRLDGSPLAIELAAGRLPLFGVHMLNGMMQDPLRLLARNRKRDAPARQQTFRAGLERSHALLDVPERTVLRRLAVFTDSAALDGIGRVTSDAGGPIDAWATMDALGVLVERSWVSLATNYGSAEPRYRLSASTRAFALECLRAAGEVDAVGRRHAEWLADCEGQNAGTASRRSPKPA